jgi:hypothetical protein
MSQLLHIFQLKQRVDTVGKLLKYIIVGFPIQALGKHMDTVMLEHKTTHQMETCLRLIRFTDDVIENEVYISAGQLKGAALNAEDVEPLGKEVLPIKVLVDCDFHVVH